MKTVSARTFDSMTRPLSRRMVDTLLSCVTPEEMNKYWEDRSRVDPGKIWDGHFRPMLDAMDPEDREQLIQEVTNYGSSMGSGTLRPGPALSLASIGDSGGAQLRRERDLNGRVCDDINEANRKFWAERLRP
jgi:hypothetical protein